MIFKTQKVSLLNACLMFLSFFPLKYIFLFHAGAVTQYVSVS